MGWLSRGASGHRATGRLAVVAVGVVLAVNAGACSSPPPLSARDKNWQQDVAYLARKLPSVRAAGFGPVSAAAWRAAAASLEAAVPQLTDGQIAVRLAQMVAMLHDDETTVGFPTAPHITLDAQMVGSTVYLLAVPAADPALLGARLLAVDGHPIAQVLARAGTTIDAEDPQLLSNEETDALDNLGRLQSLGLVSSTASAVLTVTTRTGNRETARLRATTRSLDTGGPSFLFDQLPGLAHLPLPQYQQNADQPYWLRVLPARHAVFLKYNECLSDSGFQRLAAQALTLLKAHPEDRLIVDLRGNLGGDSGPFQSLVNGLEASSQLRAPGRVIGLVDQFTDSAATVDAYFLKQAGAVVMGQPPADPLDTWGNEQTFRLPHSGLFVEYTTAKVNNTGGPLGIPGIVIKPTLAQILAGDDPVLAAALGYQRER